MLKRSLAGLVLSILSGTLAAHAGQFLEAPQYPAGTNPQAVAVADFNNDGKLDFAVANSTSNTVTILLGNGDGTFTAQSAAPATGIKPLGIAVGHFTSSGNWDIAVTNSSSNTVSILLGNGDGTFQPKIDTATGNGPQGIAVADFNNDGNLDIVVTNATDGTVGILLGKGNGTFSPQVHYNTGFNPTSVAVGKFYTADNDNNLDLAVANSNTNNVISVLRGNGDGTFQGQIQSAVGTYPVSIAVADLNGDTYDDIAVADQQGNTVTVLLGNGKGVFAPPTNEPGPIPTAPFPTSITVGDFDGDGHPDIAVSAGNGNVVSVLWGVGDGTFTGQLNAGTGNIPYSVVAGTFIPGGNTDLAVANSGGNSVSVILSNGTSRSFQARTDFPGGPSPFAVATADFNGDGIPDLAVANSSCPNFPNCSPGTISILLGNGTQGKGNGTFQGPVSYPTGTGIETGTDPHAVVVGYFNGDTIPDLAVANYATNNVAILLGNGDGTFGAPTTFAVGSEPAAIATADFNGDGNPDLVVANFNSGTVSVLLGNGNGTFKPAVNYTVGSGPVSVAAADFNGDNKLDLAVVNEGGNNVSILLGNGDGTFKPQVLYSTGAGGNPLSVVVADFRNDGNLDLAVADFRTQNVSILLGNGDGTFQTAAIFPTGANPSSVVTADFNGDGKPDLALTSTPLGLSPGNVVSLLLGNGDGTFSAPTLYGTGSVAYSAAVGSFNGDGTPGLAVANGASGTVSILLNLRGTTMSISPALGSSIYGQSVTFTTTVAASVTNGVAPTGTVTLQTGSTVLGSGPIVNGELIVTTSALPVGSDPITAAYSGDPNYQKNTISTTQTVGKANSMTNLASSLNPSALDQSITLYATVASTQGTPTGTVTFQNCGLSNCTAPVVGGGATLSTSSLAMGTNTITAMYSGDNNFNSSNSTALSQVVGKATTSTGLLAPTTANLNQNVTLTATVISAIGTPTGTVTFFDGTSQIGSPSTLNGSGVATVATSTLAVGANSITAVYGGDANNLASTSGPLIVTVVAPGFSFSPPPTLTPNSVAPGSSATATVTVAPTGGLNPSTVTLTCSVSQSGSPVPTCSMAVISVANGNGTSTLTVSTTGPQAALTAPAGVRGSRTLFAVSLLVPAMLLGGAGLSKPDRRKLLGFCVIFLVLSGCLFQAACSSGSSSQTTTTTTQPGTPAGSYIVTISGTASGVQVPPKPITLSLTVQ